VLDSRIEDADRNLQIIDEFENCCDREWPKGVRFTLGFGRAMMHAMKKYVEDNRHLVEETEEETKKAVAR
jgi:hypothetical protein